MINDEKVFFNSGDVVTLRHNIANKPTMLVVDKVQRTTVTSTGTRESTFIGIKTRWFNSNGDLNEAVWSTKDLVHVE